MNYSTDLEGKPHQAKLVFTPVLYLRRIRIWNVDFSGREKNRNAATKTQLAR